MFSNEESSSADQSTLDKAVANENVNPSNEIVHPNMKTKIIKISKEKYQTSHTAAAATTTTAGKYYAIIIVELQYFDKINSHI